jgi:hypothetical protein
MSKHDDLEPTRPAGRSGSTEVSLPNPLRHLLGRELAGCRIERLLGSGSMGAVFLAWEHSLERWVAIKVLLPKYAEHHEFLRRFENEARAAARMSSDRIVKIHRHGREANLPYVVMELVEGGTLLQQNGGQPPPIADVVHQLKEACDGLLAVEQHNLVHRDIKPANIMLTESTSVTRDGRQRRRVHLKIVDFGIARPTTDDASTTQPGTFVGSPLYASPEQCRGETLSHLSDMYSLGATFFHLLVGQPAAQGRNSFEVSAWTLSAPCLSPRGARADVPADLDAVIGKMTDRDPARRYPSFADVIDALSTIEESWRKKDVVVKRWPLVLAGFLAVALVAAAVFMHLTWKPPIDPWPQRVNELIEQAKGPDGALARRVKALETLRDRVPKDHVDSPLGKEVQSILSLVDDRRSKLLELAKPVAMQGPPTPKWAELWKQYRTPDGEEDRIAELRQRVTWVNERIGDFSGIEHALSLPDAELTVLRSGADTLLAACEKKEPKLIPLIERGKTLCRTIAERIDGKALDAYAQNLASFLQSFVQGGSVRTLLAGLPEIPKVGAACAGRAQRLAATRLTTQQVLEAALETESALGAALQQIEQGIDALLESLSAALPRQDRFTEPPQWQQWVQQTQTDARRRATDVIAADIATRRLRIAEVSDAWLANITGALQHERAIALLGERSIARLSSELEDLRQARQELLAREKKEPVQPPRSLPKGWPSEWPNGFWPQDGLTTARRDQCSVYRYGKDNVDMVLVDDAVSPFLVDVRQVTYSRFESAGAEEQVDAEYWRVKGRVNPDDDDRCLLVGATHPMAEKFAAAVGKDLMTEADFDDIHRLLPRPAPKDLVGLAVPLRTPLSRPWPAASGALAVYEICLREIVRTPAAGFAAVGHSLFEPRDGVGDTIRDLEKYYRDQPPKTDLFPNTRQTQLGFRCVLRLRR